MACIANRVRTISTLPRIMGSSSQFRDGILRVPFLGSANRRNHIEKFSGLLLTLHSLSVCRCPWLCVVAMQGRPFAFNVPPVSIDDVRDAGVDTTHRHMTSFVLRMFFVSLRQETVASTGVPCVHAVQSQRYISRVESFRYLSEECWRLALPSPRLLLLSEVGT